MPTSTFQSQRLLTDRAKTINGSSIRKMVELAAKMRQPVNLSIGQPDFPVPEPIKRAAVRAIEQDRNGYTLTAGVPELRARIVQHLREDLGWDFNPSPHGQAAGPGVGGASPVDVLVTSGTSGALLLLAMVLLQPGDEMIVPDPYFVMYPHLATIHGAKPVICDTYPDFRMTAQRVEPLITDRTKFVLLNTPGNPSGVALPKRDAADLLDLCRSRGVLLVSDEIYDEFTFSDGLNDPSPDGRRLRCPSPARNSAGHFGGEDVLVIRGFGKTYGCTGWRMGYAAGPRPIIEHMAKLQQYTFVCAPSIAQWGAIAAFDVDMSPIVDAYQRKRDMVVSALSPFTDVRSPQGAFYVFPSVPARFGDSTRFVQRMVEREVLLVPGKTFSQRDSNFRLSFATSDELLGRGLEQIAAELAERSAPCP